MDAERIFELPNLDCLNEGKRSEILSVDEAIVLGSLGEGLGFNGSEVYGVIYHSNTSASEGERKRVRSFVGNKECRKGSPII